MRAARFGLGALVVLLVVAPCLGFAAGDPAVHVRQHSRHTDEPGGGASRAAWKTTPGTPSPSLPAQVLLLAGRLLPLPIRIVPPPLLRPPFVPPRI